MQKHLTMSLVTALTLSTAAYADTDEQMSNEELTQKVMKLEKQLKKVKKTLNKVKAHDANDNIKFSADMRTSYDYLNYTYNNYTFKGTDLSGTEASNDSLLTTRIFLNMKAKPSANLTFFGQLAMYATWGGSHLEEDGPLKEWAKSSKATDTVFRLRRAYFVWSDQLTDDIPYKFSVGRRPSTDGFLLNYREGDKNPGSPLAHITNMEVDAAMFYLGLEKYLFSGSFVKFVYGRAHTGGLETLYDRVGYMPYAQTEGDVDENVDFFVVLGKPL